MKKIKSLGHIEKYKIAVIAILLAVSCFLTYYFHSVLGISIVFSHFFYIPIILSSLWWKRKGIAVAVFLGALLILSHVFSERETAIAYNFSRAIMLIAIASVVALLSEHIIKTGKELKKISVYLEKLINYANAPIIVWDSLFKITRFNRAFERLTGYTASEVIGNELKMLLPAKNREEWLSKIERTSSGEHWDSVEIPILCKDGENRLVLWNSANIYAEDGITHLATIAQGVDITKRKKAEETINKYQEQLKSLVSELIKTEDNLRHQIASNLHDRISQNLAVSKFKLELLNQDLSSAGYAADLNEILKLIEQTIHETYSLVYELTPPMLNELGLEPAVEWLTEIFQKKHGIAIEFHRDIQSKPLSDNLRGLLFQAVRELLVNVTKHARASKAKVTITRDNNNIKVSVNDDGDGFDTASLSVNKGETGGFGLFSIRERLSHLGGQLDIQSRPGRGSRFTLTLPLKRQEIETSRK